MDMFRGNTIYLRLMELQDYETTYPWRNDYNIQKMTCGPLRSVDNTHDIYLAVCMIENDKMIGYTSINDINFVNRSCDIGGIVIGDKDYRDGNAVVEVYLLLLAYIFDQLNMHRTYAYYLDFHKMSAACLEATFYQIEGCKRQAIYKDGTYHDMIRAGLMRDEYYNHKDNGEYDFFQTLKRLVSVLRKSKKKI